MLSLSLFLGENLGGKNLYAILELRLYIRNCPMEYITNTNKNNTKLKFRMIWFG